MYTDYRGILGTYLYDSERGKLTRLGSIDRRVGESGQKLIHWGPSSPYETLLADHSEDRLGFLMLESIESKTAENAIRFDRRDRFDVSRMSDPVKPTLSPVPEIQVESTKGSRPGKYSPPQHIQLSS